MISANLALLRPLTFADELGLELGGCFATMLHSAVYLDKEIRLARLLRAIGAVARGLTLAFVAHLQAARAFATVFGFSRASCLARTQPFREAISVVNRANPIINDSREITEEAFGFEVSDYELRDKAQHLKIVVVGTIVPSAVNFTLDRLFCQLRSSGFSPDKQPRRMGLRIASHLEAPLCI
jgi:hypothetical protein